MHKAGRIDKERKTVYSTVDNNIAVTLISKIEGLYLSGKDDYVTICHLLLQDFITNSLYRPFLNLFRHVTYFQNTQRSVAQLRYIFLILVMFSILPKIKIRSCGPLDLRAVPHYLIKIRSRDPSDS